MDRSFKNILVLLACVVFVNVLCGICPAGELKAGCAKIDITPPVGVWLSGYASRNKPSDGILDPLYAKALVLDDGDSKMAIVSADLLWVPLEMTGQVRKVVKTKLGIAEENLLICGTHTHFGPKLDRPTKNWPDAADSKVDAAYVASLQGKLIEVIVKAHGDMRSAKLGMTKGQAPELVYNRRTRKPDGTVAMTFKLPPADPNLTFGPTDPQVTILKVEDSDGKLLAALVNFACHPVSGDGNAEKFYSISADYPGYTAQVVEQVEGGLCFFALGTAGNINPVRLGWANPRLQAGRALGAEVLRRLQFVSTTGQVRLSGLNKTISLPLKRDLPADRVTDTDKDKESITTEIQILRIGDIYILGLPGEVLVEIGLDIRQRSGIEKLFIISLSNDGCGYVCPREAYKEGGYEPGSGTNLAEGAGEIVTEEALELLRQMQQSK